jgi:3-carboxy-cis,cis-muconate cycloisomerase
MIEASEGDDRGDGTLLDGLFATPAMARLFDDRARLQAMLAFEAALARAEAAAGVIPAEAARHIAAACDAGRFDFAALARAAADGGNLAIPLVKALTAAVGGEAGRYVHWGATSQDVIDTGFMLQARGGLDLLVAETRAIGDALAALAERHRASVMPGRTFLQHALPVTFGLKAAGWLAGIAAAHAELRHVGATALALQFGGAAGTLASLGEAGPAVAERLAADLGLPLPPLPWHGDRSRIARIAAALGLAAGALGKIALDVALLMQTEVGEAFEPAAPGKGGSSTMPHKRNPVGATLALASARQAQALVPLALQAMLSEHERAIGGWHAEWQALPEAFRLTAAAASHVRVLAEGLEVDAARMRANLDRTHGLVLAERVMMALAPQLGRLAAHHRVEAATKRAVAEGATLHAVLAADAEIVAGLGPDGLAALFAPEGYLGSTDTFIDAAGAAWRAARAAAAP